MLLHKLRKPVDSYAPWVAHAYRKVRDITAWRQRRPTAYGFSLAGSAPMAGQQFEPDEAQAFLRLCETHDIVLDIGANIGFYSCLAATRNKRVIAFEPAPRNLTFLLQNLQANGISAVEVFPVGLGRQAGQMPLFGFGGISSFVPGWAQSPGDKSSLAPVTTLDTVARGRFGGQKLLIKMDVEGFELDVLAGAHETLNRSPKPTWMLEILLSDNAIPGGINQKFGATFEVFWKYGYQCLALASEPFSVSPQMVSEWVHSGGLGEEVHNFLFFGS